MFSKLFRKNKKSPEDRAIPKPLPPRPHVRSSDLGIPPAIYTIVYEMDLFRDNLFGGTSTQLALYESQGLAVATPVDCRRDNEFKRWYLRRIREAVYFDKPLGELCAFHVYDAFFPEWRKEEEEHEEIMKSIGHTNALYARRPALFYESSLENILGDTQRRKEESWQLQYD